MATILVTGAGRGIGLQLLKEFKSQGHEVIGTVRNSHGRSKISDLSKEMGVDIAVFELEVTDAVSVAALKDKLNGKKIDILINNAGVLGGDHQEVTNLDFDEWGKTLEINVISPLRVAIALLPNIKLSEQPKIVTISSIMGSMAQKRVGSIAYRSSKSAVNKAMQCLALELQAEKVGVYLMHPGWVKTDMGGMKADITVEESAKGLARMILSFTMNESARFWQYDGQELEW